MVHWSRTWVAVVVLLTGLAPSSHAQGGAPRQPYRVLRAERVGGEGLWDYLYADADARRLYIPRRAPAPGAAGPAATTRLSVYNLDTLALIGEIEGVGGSGAAIDPKSGHGFTSSKPVSMFDTKTLKALRTIDVGDAVPDGILFDAFNRRVYVFSHPTKDAIVIDASSGTVLGRIDLGGVPEQGVSDGKGTLYVVMQDPQGSVAVVDAKTMKVTTHYPFGDAGGCNGLAMDLKHRVLFAACARSGNPPTDPPKPVMKVLSATDGRVFATLPLAGGSDGAVFNPRTMEAFSTHGNGTLTVVKETSPTSFEVAQNLDTKNGARTITFDRKTGHILTMADDREALVPGGRGRPPAIPGTFTILVVGR